MKAIYLSIDGKQTGPYTQDQLREAIEQGQVSRETPAWHEGLTEWVDAGGLVMMPPPPAYTPPSVVAPVQPDKDLFKAKPHVKKRASAMAKIGLILFMVLIGTIAWPFIVRWQIDQQISNSSHEIELDPNNLSAYLIRGGAYEQKHDYDKAIADYTAALNINPNFGVASLFRDRAYKEKADSASGGGSSVTQSTANNNNPKGELTRELAAQLLNQYLAQSNTSRLLFTPKGLVQAKADGLIIDITNKYEGYIFTDKGFAIVRGFAVDNTTERSGGTGGIPFKYISSQENVSIILHRDQDTDPSFVLTSPISEHVSQVTGISTGPFGNNIMAVEYITAYQIPQVNQAILPYIYSGRRATTTFQKYDDGWRISGNQ